MQAWTLLTGKMMGKLLLPGWPQSLKRCRATPMHCQMSLNIFLFYTCLCPEVSPCHFSLLFRRALAVFDSIWSSPRVRGTYESPSDARFPPETFTPQGEERAGGVAILTSHFICLLFLVCSLARLTARRCVIGESDFCVRGNCSHRNLSACAICLRNAPSVWMLNGWGGHWLGWKVMFRCI